MRLKLTYIWLFLGALFFLSGCFAAGDSSDKKSTVVVDNADENGQAVSLNVTSNAILQQVIPSSSASSQKMDLENDPKFRNEATSLQIYTGTLAIKEGTATIGEYDVTASLNDSNWEVKLQQTFIMAPGDYTFILFLSHLDTEEYAGIATFTVEEEQVNIVPMTIAPIIGDSVIDIETITGMGSFKFHYAEIPNLTNSDAKLGIVLDGAAEEMYYAIDISTGITTTFLNLSTGEHTIELKLYVDGNNQIAKSLPSQETQTIYAGQTISMDLIPIYGESTHSISIDGGDANFHLTIPQEIINQTTTSSNLKITYVMNGPGTDNTLYQGEISPINYNESTDVYSADLSLSGSFYAATLFMQLNFYKRADNKFIGSCTIQTSLNTNERTSLCSIPVVNSLIASGNLLAAFGITVCENNGSGGCGTLVEGANVYTLDSENGDELIGITNSNGLYIAYLKGGDYTFRAVKANGRFGETTQLTLDPLDVEDIEIILSASAPTNPGIIINNGDQFTYSKYVSLTLSAEDSIGITGYYVSEDSTPPADTTSDLWIPANENMDFETTIAFELSENIGLKTIYAWFKNDSGHRSERVQSTITVKDDTSLYFENFQFTTSRDTSPYNGSGDPYCLDLGENYRMADWNEVATILNSATSTAVTGDFISEGGLAPSSGFLCDWFGCTPPTGAFVTYNGNEQSYGENYAFSVFSDDSRDMDLGWTPHSEPKISGSAGSLQLYNITADQQATVLCYNDSGAHPLVNGDFSQGRYFWDNVMGIAEVVSGAMVLRTTEEAVTHSRIKQDKIVLKSNQNYRVTFKGQTSSLTLTAGIYGTGVTLDSVSYDVLPTDLWNVYLNDGYVELAGQNVDATGDYYSITMDFSTDSSIQQQLMIYFQQANSALGETATIDDVTLTELP
ncbi:hypothetical protein KJ966_03310 [bacterium]|nr:hypothetical protein [bacterium]